MNGGVLESCLSACPRADQYYDNVGGVCELCNSECSTCSGPANTDCLACPNGKMLHMNKCEEECPEGYASSDGTTCVACTDSRCTRCSENNPGICLGCSPGFAALNGACTDECPEGKVLVYADSVCSRCPTGCRTCTLDPLLPYSDENMVCTACISSSDILDEGKCFSDCPAGSQKILTGNTYSCQTVSCSPLCDRCQSVTKCLRCHTVDPSDITTGIIQTYDGQCLRCDAQNGLTTQFDINYNAISCGEICGDSKLHKLSKEYLEGEIENNGAIPGGLIIDSNHECDDGNNEDGDGCSNICLVEEGYVCQQESVGQGAENSRCILETQVTLTISESSLVPLTYELVFDRGTNLSKIILANNYKMVLTVDENTDTSTLPSDEIVVGYTLYTQDSKVFIIEVDGAQFDQDVSGKLGFKRIDYGRRMLQDDTGPELEGIKDVENMPVSLDSVEVDFEFDYDSYN